MAKRRGILLINPKFQLRFSFYVCSWLFCLSVIHPLIIYSLFEFFLRFAKAHLGADSLSYLQGIQAEFLWNLGLLEVSFVAITFLISLFISHKIAGPIYKLGLFLDEAKSGRLDQKLRFRKSDHFQELASGYNEMVKGLQELMGKNIETVSTSIARIENILEGADEKTREELEQVLGELRKVRERINI